MPNIHTSHNSFTHAYNANRKHKGLHYLKVDMPVIVYEMGVERARLDGDPDYINYWKRNDWKNAKAWMAKQPGYLG